MISVKDRIKHYIKNIVGFPLFALYRLYPIENKVIFSNFSGKKYGDNPKYISMALHELDPHIQIIWLKHKGYQFETPDYVKVIEWPSLKMVKELSTAKVWVDSHTKPVWIKKRKNQYYINTWHGGLGFKKVEGDVRDKLLFSQIKQSQHNSSMIDLLISNAKWLTDIYKRAFWYQGEILECGYPKNDIFYKEHHYEQKKVKDTFSIDENVSIALYAPTFRNNNDYHFLDIDFHKIIDILRKKTNKEWIVFIKLHPLMMDYSKNLKYDKQVVNVTYYDDMQELTLASDLYITDYSSGIFDFALEYKPGFLYAPDYHQYIEQRGLYFDLRKLPFPFADNEHDLINNILNIDMEKYKKDLESFFKEVGLIVSSHSSMDIAELIREKIYEV